MSTFNWPPQDGGGGAADPSIEKVADQAARLAIAAQAGDYVHQEDNNRLYCYTGTEWVLVNIPQWREAGGTATFNGTLVDETVLSAFPHTFSLQTTVGNLQLIGADEATIDSFNKTNVLSNEEVAVTGGTGVGITALGGNAVLTASVGIASIAGEGGTQINNGTGAALTIDSLVSVERTGPGGAPVIRGIDASLSIYGDSNTKIGVTTKSSYIYGDYIYLSPDEDVISSRRITTPRLDIATVYPSATISISTNQIVASDGLSINPGTGKTLTIGGSKISTNDESVDLGGVGNKFKSLFLATGISNDTLSITVAELMRCRSVAFRDASRTVNAVTGDNIFYDAANGVMLSRESVPVANGGTGATTASAAKDNLTAQTMFSGLRVGSAFVPTYDAATRIFTVVSTNGVVVAGGNLYNKNTTETTTAHANTSGKWYCYYNSSGVLTVSSTPWDLKVTAPVCAVYYNATDARATLFLDERHPADVGGMTDASHIHDHLTRGTQYLSGCIIADYTLATSTANNAASPNALDYSITSGEIADEDLRISIAAKLQATSPRCYHRSGANGDWTYTDATNGILTSGGDLAYNQNTGATWQQTAIGTNNRWMNYYVIAIQNIGPTTGAATQQLGVVQGQTLYTSQASALAAGANEIAGFNGLTDEAVILYRITYRRMSATNSQIDNVSFVVGNPVTYGSTFSPSSHTALTNRSDANSHPASAIAPDTTNFDGGLSSADDTVQKALETLDTKTQAKVLVRAYRSTTQTISNATPTAVDFASVEYDSHSAVTTGSGWKFTAPRTAKYRVTVSIRWDATAAQFENSLSLVKGATPTYLYVVDIKNGKLISTSLDHCMLQGTRTVDLAQGEYLSTRIYQASGGNLGIHSGDGQLYNNVLIEEV